MSEKGHVERRLAAILFTDVVGYTALMARDEAAGRRVRAHHELVVRTEVARYHGHWIEEKGDESLSVFPSALQAVNCALSIQATLAEHAEFQVRIGVHLGDVTIENGRVYGDGVNVAARIYPLAQPGEVAVSGPIYDSIKNQPTIEAISKGEQTLKNVQAPVVVWVVAGTPVAPGPVSQPAHAAKHRGLPIGGVLLVALAVLAVVLVVVGFLTWRPGFSGSGLAPIRSVAVLPLHDPSSDRSGRYLTFGMTEALIAELAHIEGLRVISRTSVTRYEDTDLPIRQIAAELGVDGIIEGSVLRAGDRIRVTAQLIDARSDSHLWAETYDRDMSDILSLEAEVARAIAEQVEIEISPVALRRNERVRPISPDAYEAYVKGYFFQMKRTREDTIRALRYFEKVIELEPDHPLGYSGLADEYSCAPTHSWSIAESELWSSVPQEMIDRARRNAQKALQLDDLSGPARNSIALVRMFGDWDFQGAEQEFRRAVELAPGRAWAHSTYGLLLAIQQRFAEALVHYEKARALDPLRVETSMDIASVHAWVGNGEEAYRYWRDAREIDPGFVGLHQSVITGFCGTERHAESLEALEGGNALHPGDPLIMAELAYCHAVAGDAAAARALLAQIDALSPGMYVSPVSRAMVLVGLGDHARALEELERGIRERDHLLLYLGIDRTWDSLRAEPRFTELLDHIGLPLSVEARL